ncbi:MFS transporter [Staphylococcus auricularis]|uniref:MFS transporter n=1 Tax=Staphylococcus auricularis TaxID=29379 RepID=UPI003EBFA422
MDKGHKRYDGKLVLAVCLAVLTYWLFAQSFVNIGGSVQQTFNISDSTLNLAISLVSFTTGLLMVLAGDVADRIGNLKLVIIGLLLNIIGCILLIVTPLTAFLLIGRVFQGLSAAILLPATVGLLSTQFEEENLRKALSYLMIVTVGGVGFASVVGGAISVFLNWQANFIISIIISVIALVILSRVKENKVTVETRKFDYVGMVVFAIFIMSINVLLTEGLQFGLLSILTLSLLVVAILSFVVLYFFERKLRHPFIDFSILKNRAFMGSTLNNFIVNTGIGTTVVFNMYAQQAFGMSEVQTGLVTVPYVIMAIAMVRIGEKAINIYGGKNMLIAGPLFPAIGVVLISMTFLPQPIYIAVVTIGFVICAIGTGLVATPGLTIAIFNMPQEKVSFATGLYKMGATLGGAFGLALVPTLYTIFQNFFTMSAAASGAFWFGVILMLIGVLSAYVIIPKHIKA